MNATKVVDILNQWKAAGEKFEVTPGEGASIIVENLKAKFII